MEVFSLISLLLGLAGGICAIVVPILVFVAFGIFLYRRSQQRSAAEQAAQSWTSTMGTAKHIKAKGSRLVINS